MGSFYLLSIDTMRDNPFLVLPSFLYYISILYVYLILCQSNAHFLFDWFHCIFFSAIHFYLTMKYFSIRIEFNQNGKSKLDYISTSKLNIEYFIEFDSLDFLYYLLSWACQWNFFPLDIRIDSKQNGKSKLDYVYTSK